MLDPRVLSDAVSLTASLSESDQYLHAVSDTPLALLVRETPTLAMNAESTGFSDAATQLMELSRTDAHADILQDTVQLASAAVRKTLDISRNVVMPHMRRVITAHATKVAAMGQPKLPYNIVPQYAPEVYKLQAGREFALSFEGGAAPTQPQVTIFGNFSADDIVQLARLTEDGEFNESMSDLLMAGGGKGIDQIMSVLAGVNSVDRIDRIYTLPLAIILRNLEMPQDGIAMTLSEYGARRAAAINLAGKIACEQVLRLDHYTRNNILYGNAVRASDTIEVVGEVYLDFLGRGFTSEMLIANELLGRKYMGTRLLEAEVMAELTEVYNQDRARRLQAHSINLRQASKQAVFEVLREDQKAIAEKGEFTVEGDTAEKSWMRLRDVADKVYTASAIDPEPSLAIAAIICAVWYAHTDAWRYIDIMLDVEKSRQDLDPASIATLAKLQYIAEWVASQIVTVKAELNEQAA